MIDVSSIDLKPRNQAEVIREIIQQFGNQEFTIRHVQAVMDNDDRYGRFRYMTSEQIRIALREFTMRGEVVKFTPDQKGRGYFANYLVV